MDERTSGRNRWLVPAMVAAILQGGLAQAADAEADAEQGADELQTVVVTGSNIRRADLEAVVPITVIDQSAIEVRGALLPSELLTSLPSVVNLPENETRLGSSGARGDNANLNLRNMGATATLILVNGRRMAINPFTAGLSQAVNINHLPTQGIERIEVLRDGASSVYGSDAVGGVINYVLKRDFEGLETTLRYGHPEDGGGQSLQGAVSFGTRFAGDRGRIFGTFEALYREATLLTERGFQPNVAELGSGTGALQQPGWSVRRAFRARLLADVPHRHGHGQQLLPPGQRHADTDHRRAEPGQQP
jgi:iron complex outermembrane recepter protein